MGPCISIFNKFPDDFQALWLTLWVTAWRPMQSHKPQVIRVKIVNFFNIPGMQI